jgi:MFS family permease
MAKMKIDTKSVKQEDGTNIELREIGSASSSSSAPPLPEKKKEKVRWKDLPKKGQLAILVLARLAEPLVQTSLQSYMFYQLRSFNTSLSDATISSQAGILQASFSAAQTLTGVFWGRTADTYGRKTVLLLGSLGTIISCLGFGLSKSFVAALIFRTLGGLVNGNIAVMRTMISEIIKEKKYQARAFLLMPMCFNIGVIIGPILGGVLADPAGTYPNVFGPNSFLGGKTGVRWMMYWPYLSPNLASALIVSMSLLLIFLGLDETLDAVKDRRDPGRAIGKRFVRLFSFWRGRRSHDTYSRLSTNDDPHSANAEQRDSLLSNADSPDTNDVENNTKPDPPTPKPKPKKKLPFRRIWTPNVLFTLLAHFTTAFHIGTFNNLWFIFLSADRYDKTNPPPQLDTSYNPHLPFTFTGGLAMPPRQVGIAMAILGVIGITLQLAIYPRVNDKWGTIASYRIFVYFFPIAYAMAPYLAVVPSSTEPPATAAGVRVWIALCGVLCVQVVARTFVLPATMILVNNCSPHPSVLGTIHGIAQSVGSAARTAGPAVAGFLFGVGLNHGVVGLAWWVLAAIASFGVLTSTWVREGSGHEIVLEEEEEEQQEQQEQQTTRQQDFPPTDPAQQAVDEDRRRQ